MKSNSDNEDESKQNRHTKGSWYYVWKGVYEIMELFPEYLPNTYLNYYLQLWRLSRWTKTTTKGTGTFVVVFVPRRIDAGNKRQFLE